MQYEPVRFSKAIDISNFDRQTSGKSNPAQPDYIMEYSGFEGESRGYPVPEKNGERIFYLKRHFAEYYCKGPLSIINNKGVDYALKGKFSEAEFLFKEAIKEDDKFAPAYNNLGIIFELFHNQKGAFAMYSRACIIDPENKYYRRNFIFSQERE